MRCRHLAAVAATLAVAAWAAAACAEGPEATVRRVADGLVEQQPVVLWEALPPSYQRQATELVHDLAASVDPAVHARGVAVGRKAVSVLRVQRDLILSSQLASGFTADRGRAEKGWDALVGILDALVCSDLADLEKLRTVDPAAFLRTTGRRVVQLLAEVSRATADDPYASAFMASVEGLRVEVVERSGDSATVRVTATGRPSRDLRMVRVEGRWIPQDLATSWPDMVADARAGIAALGSPEASRQRTQLMMAITVLEGLVNQLAAMKTSQELDEAYRDLVAGLAGGHLPEPSPGAAE